MSHAHVEWLGVKTFLLNDLVDFISCYLFHFLAPKVHVGTSSNMLLVIHYWAISHALYGAFSKTCYVH